MSETKEKPNPAKQHVIPVQTLKSGPLKYKVKKDKDGKFKENQASEDCIVLYEDNTSKLYFKFIDQKRFRKSGEKHFTTLEFDDITAADLRVTSKFGSWDSMTCRLLVENRSPLSVWTVEKLRDVKGLAEREGPASEGREDEDTTAYVRRSHASCMIKVTIGIENLQPVRDVLHFLKVNKLRERRVVLENHKKGFDKDIRAPSKIREGLPEWVNYIPAKWYTCTVRQVFEYVLIFYSLVTLLWAMWQLYKHVGFVRDIVRPFIEIIELYLTVLRAWFRWLDRVTDTLTDLWWMYAKPIFLIATPLYTALASLFKPLRNVADVITMVTQPVSSMFGVLASVVRPMFQPAIALFQVVWKSVSQWPIVRIVMEKFGGWIRFLFESNLDPLKTHMMLIQSILWRSIKQVMYGLKFFFNRIYYMIVFVRRERDYANEDQANTQTPVEKEKAE